MALSFRSSPPAPQVIVQVFIVNLEGRMKTGNHYELYVKAVFVP